MNDDFDALGLIGARSRVGVHFGSVDAGVALVRANMSSRMNQMPSARLVAAIEQSPGPIDYFAGLAIVAHDGETRIPRFTGSVVTAAPVADGVEVDAQGAVALAEGLIGGMVVRGVPHHELVYVMARSAGFREEHINIQGFPEPPRESFEVVVPIDGLKVNEPTIFAGVRFLPAKRGRRALGTLEPGPDLNDAFDAPTYALALATSTRMLDAEQSGLGDIDFALAWLTTRLRYGLASLPDGQLLPFARSESLVHARARDLVSVRGLLTGRHWLRRPQILQEERSVPLTGTLRFDPDLPALSLQDRQAVLALARATREPDPLAQVHALWEAIEFYAHAASIDHLFTTEQLNSLRALLEGVIPESFTQLQRERVVGAIDGLNNPPLLARLRAVLDIDQVPYDEGEIELLRRLRGLRNDVVHGRGRDLPQREDIEHSISVVSRMLVHRVGRRAAETS